MGKDRITSTSAELPGRKTNHSARKTIITTLTNNNVPETEIIQLTGHRNLQSLNSSSLQQKEMSHALSAYSAPPTTTPLYISTTSEEDNRHGSQSYFANAHLTG